MTVEPRNPEDTVPHGSKEGEGCFCYAGILRQGKLASSQGFGSVLRGYEPTISSFGIQGTTGACRSQNLLGQAARTNVRLLLCANRFHQ